MKKYWLIILLVLLTCAAQAYEVVAYHEDFESGATGWQMFDGTQSPNNWHIYNYGGAQGNAWWMGDPALASGANIGGYYDHQYLVLDTPARTLSAANATLTFKMRLGLESVGGTGEYNGWDSFNVRVSTNGGSTWNVITGSPAYHYTSSYAFGSEHGEGPGIPGWGGMLTNWATATFSLSAYVGQSVKIRFAFASDPAHCTSDEAQLFGVMLDDISFGGYTNNGVNDGQMTWASLVPVGGQLWHIATEAGAPSPTQVMKNQNATGTYNPNMLNYLISPAITLPSEGDIRADFMIKGSFTDTGTFPNVDYWGWEISTNDGLTWNAMSNPYADPTGNNYVYSDAPTTWSSMIESFSLNGLITNFGGQTVKFRWYFKSNDTVNGTGIMIDDFKIYNDVFVAPPENLTATVSGMNVLLDWDAPGTGGDDGEEGWLQYCGENSDSIGTGALRRESSAARTERNVSNYRVYRNGIMITQLPGTVTQYTEINVDNGIHSYYVTAMYGTDESTASNSQIVFVMSSDQTESAYDDGSAEMGLILPTIQQMAVLHNTFANQSLTVQYAAVYIHTVNINGLIMRVYEYNNTTGMPGPLIFQFQYPASSIIPGWNYIPFPDEITIPEGRFFLGMLVNTNYPQIGVDTSSFGHSYITTGGTWGAYSGGEIMIRAIVELNGAVQYTQNVPLSIGWNLASLNVSPADHSLPAILGNIAGAVAQIKGTDGVYIPDNPYSSLTSLTDGKAYSIKMNSAATWSVTGNQIPANTPLPLASGWNMAAYLPQTAMPVVTAMQSISPWLQQVKGQDGVYIPDNPYSSLSTMFPGKGYWIQINGAHQLVYPAGTRLAIAPTAKAQKSLPEPTVLPQSMTLLARCDWAEPGDMLLAKVGDELRGAQELIDLEGFPAALLQIYCDVADEALSLWIMKPDGALIPVSNRISSMPQATLGHYPEFIELHQATDTPGSPVLNNALLGSYPNPFNPSTTISFSIAEDNTPVSLNIYNLRGQRVARLINDNYNKGLHKIVWNGTDQAGRPQGSGLYIIELQAGAYRKTAKTVLAK